MITDEPDLITRAQRNPRDFGPLYERYVERIYAYVQREVQNPALAQDIVARTFEKALRNLPGYRWRGTSFGAWLYQIARNEIRMNRRQRWWLPLGSLVASGNVEQQVQQRQDTDAVATALARLSANDQEILRLRYYEDLSNPEIGEVLGKASKTVAVAVHRALKRLRRQLENQSQEACSHDDAR